MNSGVGVRWGYHRQLDNFYFENVIPIFFPAKILFNKNHCVEI